MRSNSNCTSSFCKIKMEGGILGLRPTGVCNLPIKREKGGEGGGGGRGVII